MFFSSFFCRFFFSLLFVFFCRFFDFFFFLFLAAEAPQTVNNNTGRGGGERAGQSDGAVAGHQNAGTPEWGATEAENWGLQFSLLMGPAAGVGGCEGSRGLRPLASVGILFFLRRMKTRGMESSRQKPEPGLGMGAASTALTDLERRRNPTTETGEQVDGKGMWGGAPGRPPWAWRGLAGACCWGGPAGARLRAGPGSLSPGDGVLWPQVLGGLAPAHHDAKNGTRYCVSGCMDAEFARRCSWGAGSSGERGETSAGNQGRGEWGEGRGRGLAGGGGLRWSLCCDLSPGPQGCYGHVCVSLDVVSVSPCLGV